MMQREHSAKGSGPEPSVLPKPGGLLQRKCACGGSPGFGGECEECREKKMMPLQRRAADAAESSRVPPIVYDVLRSPGEPLDPASRAFFEPRFGHDFSHVRVSPTSVPMFESGLAMSQPGDSSEQEAERTAERVTQAPGRSAPTGKKASPGIDFGRVRVHTDAQAMECASAVGALAFTIGRDIVFGAGQYQPGTSAGNKLLAHGLAHVVQQETADAPVIHRKIGTIAKAGCSVILGMDIGIYGARANAALAAKWQGWINSRWNGTAACHGNSAGTCATSVNAAVTAHPSINWWWKVPEANSAFVRKPGYRSKTNRAVDSGDWAEDEDELSIAHEVGHLMGQGDYYWRLPFRGERSESGFVNDIMANYYKDPGPTEFGPALTRVLTDHDIECLCCIKYPSCSTNNCALNPGLSCGQVGERRHCEWIRANNTPEALARYNVDCSMLSR